MKNRPVQIDGKEEWISRSIAAVTYVFTDINGDTYVLANKRGKGMPNNVGKWNAPSGFLDYDEDLEDCAVREVFEETGVKIKKEDVKMFQLDSDPKRTNQVVLARFFANYDGDPDVLTTENAEPDEVEEVKWVKINDIKNYEWTSEAHHEAMVKALSRWFATGAWLK